MTPRSIELRRLSKEAIQRIAERILKDPCLEKYPTKKVEFENYGERSIGVSFQPWENDQFTEVLFKSGIVEAGNCPEDLVDSLASALNSGLLQENDFRYNKAWRIKDAISCGPVPIDYNSSRKPRCQYCGILETRQNRCPGCGAFY